MTSRRSPPIAVLTTACRFPEAATPAQLWENILAGRRAFRAMPANRLDLADYAPERVGQADTITPVLAALLTDWQFDRARFRVPQASFEAADLAHWLALETAADAIAECGGADALPRDRTAVIIGNTLTGEFSRTAQLRLRFPYLRRQLTEVFTAQGLDRDTQQALLGAFGARLASDLPAPTEDTLAGGLANTIAGRIANHFDFHGGAWTVDGACASSLLAINDACTRIAEGSIDAAIVGGVDLSLDPFELVGFSRNGALAREEMRVFDRRSAGFWPGEGCGMVLLARPRIAEQLGREPQALVAGWGVSTDGAGGLTRPTAEGQLAALRQAYQRAQIKPNSLGYVEAHGTGTAVGDRTEISALATLLEEGADAPVAVGSIKANIGHTKAAAGVAGFIKAVCAVRDGFVPPHVSCQEPHAVFRETGDRLTPACANPWPSRPKSQHRVAGVSGFGFGGVNAHVVLTSTADSPDAGAPPAAPHQDVELFVFGEQDPRALRDTLATLHGVAASLSLAQLSDAAADSARRCRGLAPWRAAVVASRPAELAAKLATLLAALDSGEGSLEDEAGGLGFGHVDRPARVGLLFPGQAAPVRPTGGAWHQRFNSTRQALVGLTSPPPDADLKDTAIAQPFIAASSLAACQLLTRLGLNAEVALGHSLGELAALHWAGALSAQQLVALATARGRLMAAHARPGGGMMRITLSERYAREVAGEYGLQIACVNGAQECVLAGPLEALERCAQDQQSAGVETGVLAVSHAFHTEDMAPAAQAFRTVVEAIGLGRVTAPICSTVRARKLDERDDLAALLVDQLVMPVRFSEALAHADVDVWLEVGAGAGLSRLAEIAGHRAYATDAFANSLRGLADGLCGLWLAGADIDLGALFADRPARPFDATCQPTLLANPCGEIRDEAAERPEAPIALPEAPPEPATAAPTGDADDVLGQVLAQVANELALPAEAVTAELRFLDDLHLNSLAVGRIVSAVAQQLEITAPAASTDFANATLGELAEHLQELRDLPVSAPQVDRFDGVAPWIANFAFEWTPTTTHPSGNAMHWIGEDQPFPPINGASPPPGAVAGLLLELGHWDSTAADPTEALRELWNRVRRAAERGARHLAIVHQGAPISAFARSLVHERTFERVVVLERSTAVTQSRVQRALAKVPNGYSEWRLDTAGNLHRPVFRQLPEDGPLDQAPLGSDDLLVVSGGARGIGAECALRLAKRFGVRLALLGRSPAEHEDVRQTLDRASAEGLQVTYHPVDVIDAPAVRATLEHIASDLGPITALMHAAGINHPMRFLDVDDAELQRTLEVKARGIHTLLHAVATPNLRLVISFGSIIGRLGHAGETHYALANQLQSTLLGAFAQRHPQVRTLALEWSVWGSVGMGDRLGTLERLASQGVQALPLDKALDALEANVASDARGSRVVTARFGPPSGVDLESTPSTLPLHRFLETVQVHYPGLELVADARLSLGNDPYLADHIIDGETVMPGVMLLEAMGVAASALANGELPSDLRAVQFSRPVVLPSRGELTLRVAALRVGPTHIECVVRTSADGFASVVSRAQVHFDTCAEAKVGASFERPAHPPQDADALYGPLFFNAGRFKRLEHFTRLCAFELSAHFSETRDSGDWFGSYQPQGLLLGDPGVRDAGLHALQAGVPQRRVVPVAVEHIVLHDVDAARTSMEARQRRASGDDFEFDIHWRDSDGRIVEQWLGAHFRAIATRGVDALDECLLVPWLEREIALQTDRDDIRIAQSRGDDRDERRDDAAQQLAIDVLLHRGDGKPTTPAVDAVPRQVSVTHCQDETLLITARTGVGCDLEMLEEDSPDTARNTACWCAQEALRKCGVLAPAVRSPARDIADDELYANTLHVEGHDVLIRRWGRDRVLAVALGNAHAAGVNPTLVATAEDTHSSLPEVSPSTANHDQETA